MARADDLRREMLSDMDTIQMHVREQKDKQAELIVKFTKAIEQAGKL